MTGVQRVEDDRVGRAFGRHHAELRRFAQRLVGDAEVGADLASEAFTRLVMADRAGRFPDAPRAWLFRVAGNLAASHGRRLAVRNRKEAAVRARATFETGASPEEDVILRERLEDLRRALDRLNGDARVALLLRAAGYDGRAIAERIGRSHAATRVLMSRTRGPLKRDLQAQRS